MFKNGDLRSFFKKTQAPAPKPAEIKSEESHLEQSSLPTNTTIPDGFSTSWSPGPRTPQADFGSDVVPSAVPTAPTAGPSSSFGNPKSEGLVSSKSFIKSSDDEESDSDSSLEDLQDILLPKSSTASSQPVKPDHTPPRTTRYGRQVSKVHASPLAVLPKYKFDLGDLIKDAKDEERLEASSKRVKAMIERANDSDITNSSPDSRADSGVSGFQHGKLLESVVAEREDGGMQKVLQAMRRTEATLVDQRWYFFDVKAKKREPEQQPFPTSSVSKSSYWKDQLKDPAVREQAFVSGFVEDLIVMGTPIPDELFLWLLNEIYFETDDYLQNCYFGVITQLQEQVQRLVDLETVRKMLVKLGGTSTATDLDQKIKPVPALKDQYAGHDWTKLSSIVRFLGKIGKLVQLQVRIFLVGMLLRMSIDNIVTEDIDLFSSVQEALESVCGHVPDDIWEQFCVDACGTLFKSVDPSTLRLHVINCIPSTSGRIHELRRRLALAFYFNNIKYTTKPSYSMINLNDIRIRLDDVEFKANEQTDFRELAARITLLDIAVDDGRHEDLDLTNPKVEEEFNESVDALVSRIKAVLRATSTTAGAAFISRIEAKEVVDLVSNRIMTIRARRKARISVFDPKKIKKEEDFSSEKKGLQRFLTDAG
ncbi:hypothetical protein F5884DRAFT_278129 [Xylogone sp. PMI_703]|nr:hypothetical protein F5884DRAFT_278129 [Xylogone sp. PMI_703]